MNFITKEELEKKDIVSKFTVSNGNLILPKDCEYKSKFDVGDIVAHKDIRFIASGAKQLKPTLSKHEAKKSMAWKVSL